MADLNVSMVSSNTERIQPQTKAEPSVKAADTLIEQNKDDSSRKEHIKEVLEDVIAVSKDGDTAQASKNAKDKLQENKELGDVKELTEKSKPSDEPSAAKKLLDEMKKEQESKPSPAERAKEEAEKAKARIEETKEKQGSPIAKEEIPKITKPASEQKAPSQNSNIRSFDNYTDSQLRQMYIKGDISRYDYDHELENRQESSDIRSIEERYEKVFREGIVRTIKNENKAELSGNNIERAFDEEANDNMKAEQRMAMIDAAELTG